MLGYNARQKELGFTFNEVDSFNEKVENWENTAREFMFFTTQGWAAGTVITLSPGASKIQFDRDYVVVDNLYDKFYDYSILKADGQPLQADFNGLIRDGNSFGLAVSDTEDGLYHITLPIVQKEHVVLLENKTEFSDIIYYKNGIYDKLYYDSSLVKAVIEEPYIIQDSVFYYRNMCFYEPDSVFYFKHPISFVGSMWDNVFYHSL